MNTNSLHSTDYYPFGMVMSERSYSYTSKGYRFGFNGMEKDDELYDKLGAYGTLFRQYDPRLGRWFSVDPIEVGWESPYVAFRNTPVSFSDPNGDCPDCPDKTYEIKKGDNYWDLETKWGLDHGTLESLNPGLDPTKLQIGQKINVLRTLNPEQREAVDNSSSPTFTEEGGQYEVRDVDTKLGKPSDQHFDNKNNIYAEFVNGTGPVNSVFDIYNPQTADLMEVSEVERMKYLAYLKFGTSPLPGASYTNFGSSFGLNGVVDAGTNYTYQFVGTFSGDIFVSGDGQNLIIVISDAKTLTSLGYRLLPSHERSEGMQYYGNTYQKYVWTEPINVNFINSYKKKYDRGYGIDANGRPNPAPEPQFRRFGEY